MSVRLVQTCLELLIFIFLSQVSLRSVSGQSQVTLRSVLGHSQVSLCPYFISQTEPKILRLVYQSTPSCLKVIGGNVQAAMW